MAASRHSVPNAIAAVVILVAVLAAAGCSQQPASPSPPTTSPQASSPNGTASPATDGTVTGRLEPCQGVWQPNGVHTYTAGTVDAYAGHPDQPKDGPPVPPTATIAASASATNTTPFTLRLAPDSYALFAHDGVGAHTTWGGVATVVVVSGATVHVLLSPGCL